MAQTVVRLPDVKRQSGGSRSWVYKEIRAGRFPAPIKIGIRAVAWLQSDLDEWLTHRIELSRGAQTSARITASATMTRKS